MNLLGIPSKKKNMFKVHIRKSRKRNMFKFNNKETRTIGVFIVNVELISCVFVVLL